jgi:hypothetical protein
VNFELSQIPETNNSTKDFIIRIIKEQKPETTQQLIGFLQKNTSLTENEILELLNQLVEEEKIHFISKQDQVSSSNVSSLSSFGSAWYGVVIAISIVTTLIVFIIPANWYPFSLVRNILGLIFVLFLPGYAFTKVFFPTNLPIQASSRALDNIERIALSIAMSLALTPIVGLILYYTPLGTGLMPITLSLLSLTMVLATAAITREYQAKTVSVQSTY